ncbi:MAG: hypothetical protein KBS66_02250 [Eubacterium sp.]|nr:hypothetical protein [Candidatus Colimonas fimequi]
MQRKTILQAGLEEILSAQKAQLEKLSEERDNIAPGILVLKHIDGNEYYYDELGKERHGITKDMNRVYELARAKYLDIKISELTREIAITENTIRKQQRKSNSNIQKFMARFKSDTIDFLKFLCSPGQYAYATAPSMNPGYRQDLRFILPDGRLTRNISERDIGRLLIAKRVPFQYECELIVDVTDLIDIDYDFIKQGRKYKKYYPDFVIPFADGSIFIWEHLGFITDEKYRFKQGTKLIAYLNGEAVDIRHLFYSFPKDLKDYKYLNHIIDTRIAPFV